LETVKRLTEAISRLESVRNVYSLANARRIYWVPTLGSYSPRLGPLSGKKSHDSASITRLREYVTSEEIYAANYISRDGRHLSMIIDPDPAITEGNAAIDKIRQLRAAIIHTLNAYQSPSLKFHLVGPSLIDVALQDILETDLQLFCWLSAIFVILILFTLFKRWEPVALASLVALMALLWSLGILSLTQTPVSVGLAMIVPLILTNSIAYSIHYLENFFGRVRIGEEHHTFFPKMIALLAPPSLLTGLTTAIGFFSLGVSELKGIQEVGFYIALGILACTYLNNVFLPAVLHNLASVRVADKKNLHLPSFLSGALVNYIEKRSKTILLLASALAMAAAIGLYQLRLDTNHLYYFKKDAPLRKDFLFVDQNFGGSVPLEIMVAGSPRQISGLVSAIDRLETSLRKLSGIGNVLSAVDFLKMAERSKPQNFPALSHYFDFHREIFPPDLWERFADSEAGRSYVSRQDSTLTLRIACRAFVQGSEKLHELLQQVERLAAECLPQKNVTITGLAPFFVQIDRYVVRSQINSFGVALLTTLLLLSILSRSWRLGLLAMAVNVLPVLLVLGFMGWAGIPLDISTVMIASIAIGIVVDDTIHFLYRYRQEMRASRGVMEGVKRAFDVVGSPILSLSIVIAGGFFVMAPSRFAPTSYFGLLSGLTVIIAVSGDLILLPALINVFRNFAAPKTSGPSKYSRSIGS
jgi:predicted RND superfamily exporter protein